ncbi:sporulation phosphorelay system protein KapB [Paenibacillus sp.]|uniref:sporulation phosphorelay system protein KapB n=1 Tax=Paenibacillus sp. TaxID=58172 RepID=UPI002D46EE7D|nr:sporulation phosphorelay system protein KapB [Paenibacillus sp.]HZG55464.1 sporulation phosphorelay system protein KapB [Paenibacillus sp.]
MNVGDLVVAPYKSGVYVGELIQLDRPKAKVRMLAVLRHPTQGDLHHPMQADVAFFHERRALAFREVANVFASELVPYDGAEAPDYRASLAAALEAEREAMAERGDAFGQRAVESLERLRRDYFGA